MKKLLLFLLFPLLGFTQVEHTIRLKVAVMQKFTENGDAEGEKMFWQTKGKITYAIVNYTDEQNPIFKELFISQYRELLAIFKKMNQTESEADTALYVKTLIRQEEDYRNLLTPEQRKKYLDKLADFEKNNKEANDSYSSLFFSEKLLIEYKAKTK